jgi:hypothetical protein
MFYDKMSTFLKKETRGLHDNHAVCLPVCLWVPHKQRFKPTGRYSWNSAGRWRPTPHFLISQIQPFQNGRRSNFWGGCKTCTSQRRFWQILSDEQLVRNEQYERGRRLNIKIHILLYGDNSWTVGLRQIKFDTVKDHGYNYKFYMIHCFVWRSL